ncbi:MAG: AraC family transcriptional regulator [Verrucomicrobia bacterium]|nr:AraC family transcriptional regulator [Verrucomicrobiota bacterium]
MLEDLKLGPAYEGFLFLAESVRNPPVLRPHHHIELELNLVAQGSITYVVDGRRYTFKKGELLWMFPAQEHQLVDRSADAAYYVAVFKPGLIQRSCRGERYSGLKKQKHASGMVLHTDLSPRDFDTLRQEMDALIADGLDADVLNREAGFGLSGQFTFKHNDPDWLNAGLRHILLFAWRLQQGHNKSKNAIALHPAVRKALEYINLEPVADADIATLARHCGVSDAYLSRIFHKQIGVTLSRYRNSIRISKFWKLYRKSGQKGLLDAVYGAGFGSYAQFFRVFTSTYGKGPRQALKTT